MKASVDRGDGGAGKRFGRSEGGKEGKELPSLNVRAIQGGRLGKISGSGWSRNRRGWEKIPALG